MRIVCCPSPTSSISFRAWCAIFRAKPISKMELVTKGEDTGSDRSVIEVIDDPLIHLIRNSVDHGIEPPAVRVAAGKAERGTITPPRRVTKRVASSLRWKTMGAALMWSV